MNKDVEGTYDPDMLPEYDFSQGVRGKYVERFAEGVNIVILPPGGNRNTAIHLDADVSTYLNQIAEEQEIAVQDLVNEWLRASMRVAQSVTVKIPHPTPE